MLQDKKKVSKYGYPQKNANLGKISVKYRSFLQGQETEIPVVLQLPAASTKGNQILVSINRKVVVPCGSRERRSPKCFGFQPKARRGYKKRKVNND